MPMPAPPAYGALVKLDKLARTFTWCFDETETLANDSR